MFGFIVGMERLMEIWKARMFGMMRGFGGVSKVWKGNAFGFGSVMNYKECWFCFLDLHLQQ